MSTADIVMIVIGLGLVVAVWFAQSAGFSAGRLLRPPRQPKYTPKSRRDDDPKKKKEK